MIKTSITTEGLQKLLFNLLNKEPIGIGYKDGMLVFGADIETPKDFTDVVLLQTDTELCSVSVANGKIETFSVLFKELSDVQATSPEYKILLVSNSKTIGCTSQADAAKKLGVTPSAITKAIQRQNRIKGYKIVKC